MVCMNTRTPCGTLRTVCAFFLPMAWSLFMTATRHRPNMPAHLKNIRQGNIAEYGMATSGRLFFICEASGMIFVSWYSTAIMALVLSGKENQMKSCLTRQRKMQLLRLMISTETENGRPSCRERVCQYV